MLHIIFIILKVIGIILAVALGIVIVSLLCILFVPVRYKVEAKKEEDLWIAGKISWLCAIVYIKLLYEKEKFGIIIRIFGHTIYNSNSNKNLKAKKSKNKKVKSNKQKKKKKEISIQKKDTSIGKKETSIVKKETSIDKKETSIEDKESNQVIKVERDTKHKRVTRATKDNIKVVDSSNIAKSRLLKNLSDNESSRTKRAPISEENHRIEQAENTKAVPSKEYEQINIKSYQELKTNETSKGLTTKVESITEKKVLTGNEKKQEKKVSIDKKETFGETESTIKHEIIQEKKVKIDKKETKDIVDKDTKKEKVSFVTKIKNIYLKIKEKCKNFINSLRKFFSKIKDIRATVTKVLHLLQDERIKAGIKLVLKSLIKTLKYLYPKKLCVNVKYGTGDPCSTGQILAGISLFTPIYKEDIRIYPDFEDSVFEFDLYAIGRIRIISLLIICIKLIRDKNFRFLLSNIQKMKEEL